MSAPTSAAGSDVAGLVERLRKEAREQERRLPRSVSILHIELLRQAADALSAATARAEKAEALANSEGSDASAARKRVRELVAQIAALEESNTVIGEKVQLAEAERDALKALLDQAAEVLGTLADTLTERWEHLDCEDGNCELQEALTSAHRLHAQLTQQDKEAE